MINLITKIMSLAYVVSTTTKHDVFCGYSPHCNSINVDIHENGWVAEEIADSSYIVYLNHGTLEQNIKRLYEIKKAIEGLKNE